MRDLASEAEGTHTTTTWAAGKQLGLGRLTEKPQGAAAGTVLCLPELFSAEERGPTRTSPGVCGFVSLTLIRYEGQFKTQTQLPDSTEKIDLSRRKILLLHPYLSSPLLLLTGWVLQAVAMELAHTAYFLNQSPLMGLPFPWDSLDLFRVSV